MSFENVRNRYKKKIHFIGIGGIGMSAIALILKRIGCSVQGSDLGSNNNTKALQDKGIDCFVGHETVNVTDDVELIVKTSIVKEDNPEIIAAKQKGIAIIRRADMLATIMKEKKGVTISGTHGKTSTTAMVAVLLEEAGLDPMVINGGIMNHYGSNAKYGEGDYVVAESDESDGSFIDLPSFIGAITNIEHEHLEFYNDDFEKVKSYYQTYVDQIPDEGLLSICIDDKGAKQIYENNSKKKCILSYGLREEADIVARNVHTDIDGQTFDAELKKSNRVIEGLQIPAYGIHHVSNSLIALAIADYLGLDDHTIKKAFAKFSGVQRRFTNVGQVNGATIIDDYAHHPTEIQATFKAARDLIGKRGKVIAVFQPHKYTRTRDLFEEFSQSFKDVDAAIIADVYSAGQEPIQGISADSLVEAIKEKGHENVSKLAGKDELPEVIKGVAQEGDIVVCAGAGSISLWARELESKAYKIVK